MECGKPGFRRAFASYSVPMAVTMAMTPMMSASAVPPVMMPASAVPVAMVAVSVAPLHLYDRIILRRREGSQPQPRGGRVTQGQYHCRCNGETQCQTIHVVLQRRICAPDGHNGTLAHLFQSCRRLPVDILRRHSDNVHDEPDMASRFPDSPGRSSHDHV